jgi:ubiquinone/menaquinone biosynthesis C-methylase UbiE
MTVRSSSSQNPKNHFRKRAAKYDNSSRWVNDPLLIKKMLQLSGAGKSSRVLDVAIGTGKISRVFSKKAGYVVGLDNCRQMISRARGAADAMVLSNAEKLPFRSGSFDLCVCRQGLQFMRLDKVLSEMRRVLKPGGKVVLCHLTAYGQADRKVTFYTQKLRNPARKNFFMPGDIPLALKRNKFAGIKNVEYITRESVNKWIDNGAIPESAKEKIREAYRQAPEDFKKIHNVRFAGNDIFDSMKMVIACGGK